MDFLLDNIIWLFIGGVIIFNVISSMMESGQPGKQKNSSVSHASYKTTQTAYKPSAHTSPNTSRGYSPSKGLSKKEQIVDNKIKSGQNIRVRYIKQNGTVTNRTLKPLYLKHENGCMYLRAFCYLRKEERTFRLSRMEILS